MIGEPTRFPECCIIYAVFQDLVDFAEKVAFESHLPSVDFTPTDHTSHVKGKVGKSISFHVLITAR